MKILLDTHVFLWYITGDARLPKQCLSEIRKTTNEVFLSVASVWESVIKFQLGKLALPSPPHYFMPQQRRLHGIGSVDIDEDTVTHLANLPSLHRDPFDRILVAQAQQHNLHLATVDSAITAYGVNIIPI